MTRAGEKGGGKKGEGLFPKGEKEEGGHRRGRSRPLWRGGAGRDDAMTGGFWEGRETVPGSATTAATRGLFDAGGKRGFPGRDATGALEGLKGESGEGAPGGRPRRGRKDGGRGERAGRLGPNEGPAGPEVGEEPWGRERERERGESAGERDGWEEREMGAVSPHPEKDFWRNCLKGFDQFNSMGRGLRS